MNRLDANKELLRIIETYVDAHPELRFHQILVLLDVVNHGSNSVMAPIPDFYTESATVLDRVKKNIAHIERNTDENN